MRWIMDFIHLKWSDVIGQIRLSICNINLAAYGRSVDIANSRKILFNVYFEIIQ